jgi:hypothetical protein
MIKLARLPAGWRDRPQLFERYWDEAVGKIEETLNSLLMLPIIEDALSDVVAATALATSAATEANTATLAQRAETSIINSYINVASFTGDLISTTEAGVITVKTHERVYGDPAFNPSVSVSGAVITTSGTTTGSIVRIYYNDIPRSGGTVDYLYTVDPAPPPVQSGSTHSVGAVEIPANGMAAGKEIKNPGYVEV